jgi:hypothetical protein
MRAIGIASVILGLFFSACEKTEKVEDFPQHKSQLVVNCFFRPDTPFIFNLSKSLSPLDNASFRVMNSPSAFIKVFENGILFDSLRANSKGVFIGRQDKLPKNHGNYRFECSYPGFGIVKGEDYLPDTFVIKRAEGFNLVRSSHVVSDTVSYIEHSSQLRLDLESVNAQGDYLMLEIGIATSSTPWGYFSRNLADLQEVSGQYDAESMYDIRNRVFVSNNGKKINTLIIRWEMIAKYRNGNIRNNYFLRIWSCSKNAFEYLRRSALQNRNEDDPFSQPTPISNSIDNGYGVFGGISLQQLKVSF